VHATEHEARYEARREAASAMVIAVVLLAALALGSWKAGWVLMELPWWSWLVLAVPGLVLCLDLWLGARRLGFAGTRGAALVLLGLILLGNVIGVVILVGALVTTKSDDLSGVQLLVTVGTIWAANVVAFGLCYWDLDDGGPLERARHERESPDFRFPQDETPEVAKADWHPRVWDYIYVAFTSATAFSPTDTMPLTLRAKLLVAVEELVSIVLIVLVTARAVSVLGT
jgi:uncharacterized membrane protein